MSSSLHCYALLQANTASFRQSPKAWMPLSKSYNLYEPNLVSVVILTTVAGGL